MTRPRVMHVVVGGDIGGAERLLVEIGRRPDPTGADHEVAVFTPNRALVAYFGEGGLEVHDRGAVRDNPLAYLYRSLGPVDVAWLTRLVQNRRIDIVHSHTFASHVLATRVALRARLPQLRTEHGTVHYFDAGSAPFTRWAASRTDRLAAVSEHVKRTIAGTAPEVAERMGVIRNGVDTAYFAPQEPAPGARDLSLVIVCRLSRWKRVDLAIVGAARARVPLVVVGEGEDRARLERVAKAAGGRTRFVGRQADPRPFIAGASALLSTSRQEPLGLSILEALAMQRPVIGVAEGGVAEIVRDGETGFLVREATVEALTAAIEQARAAGAAGRLAEMGRRARRWAVEECSIESMCRGYAGEYEGLMGPSSRP